MKIKDLKIGDEITVIDKLSGKKEIFKVSQVAGSLERVASILNSRRGYYIMSDGIIPGINNRKMWEKVKTPRPKKPKLIDAGYEGI